jgi:hypothetical protein
MIQLFKTSFHSSFLHFVGNKNNDEGVIFSANPFSPSQSTRNNLLNYFLRPFLENEEYYQLYHDTSLDLNEVYTYVTIIFSNKEQLYEQSINLAKHLYNQSFHPKIKGGEFYIVYFKDCVLNGETLDAIGLFKSENKDIFLKVYQQNGGFNLESEKGINIKKLDKGCLILNKDRENGYVVALVDNTNKGLEAQYWIDDFLHVHPRQDEYSNTKNFLSLVKTFITNELPREFDISKADQINLLNKSLDFFKANEILDIIDFTNSVITQPEIIDKFRQSKKKYEISNDLVIDNKFSISETAIKKQQRSYKRVIQLDQKIKIIIDGNRDKIIQGEDAKGKYYKVYYIEEK